MNITDIFQLKVAYPYGGEHFLLEWQTRGSGNHVVISRSEKGIDSTVKRLLENSGMVRFGQYLLVDIVAPSHAMKLSHANNEMLLDFNEFLNNVGDAVVSSAENGLSLPDGIRSCPEKRLDGDYHFGCETCGGYRYVMDNDDPQELYKRNIHKIERKESQHKLSVSSAAEMDNRTLHAVRRDFGHHRAGLLISRYGSSADCFSDVNFFYHEISCIGAGKFEKMAEEVAARLVSESESKMEMIRRYRANIKLAEAKKANEKLFSYFSSK